MRQVFAEPKRVRRRSPAGEPTDALTPAPPSSNARSMATGEPSEDGAPLCPEHPGQRSIASPGSRWRSTSAPGDRDIADHRLAGPHGGARAPSAAGGMIADQMRTFVRAAVLVVVLALPVTTVGSAGDAAAAATPGRSAPPPTSAAGAPPAAVPARSAECSIDLDPSGLLGGHPGRATCPTSTGSSPRRRSPISRPGPCARARARRRVHRARCRCPRGRGRRSRARTSSPTSATATAPPPRSFSAAPGSASATTSVSSRSRPSPTPTTASPTTRWPARSARRSPKPALVVPWSRTPTRTSWKAGATACTARLPSR